MTSDGAGPSVQAYPAGARSSLPDPGRHRALPVAHLRRLRIDLAFHPLHRPAAGLETDRTDRDSADGALSGSKHRNELFRLRRAHGRIGTELPGVPPPHSCRRISKTSRSAPALRGASAISPWNGRSGRNPSPLLPEDTVQHRTIQARIDEIDRQRTESAGAPQESDWRQKLAMGAGASARCCSSR